MKMKKLILAAVTLLTVNASAQLYKAKDNATEISFFSKSPLEDITATNKGAVIFLKTTTADVQVQINILKFKFKNEVPFKNV